MQRKSDGVVVPVMAVQHNTVGGKGPDFSGGEDEGKRKGMTGTARSNFPRKRERAVNVRKLQNRLWAAAKQSPERRFHALFDRIHRSDVLWEAWVRVKANRGAAGVDALTVAAVVNGQVEVSAGGHGLSSPRRNVSAARAEPLGLHPRTSECSP